MLHFKVWLCGCAVACVVLPTPSFAVPVTLSFTEYTHSGTGSIELLNNPDGTAHLNGSAYGQHGGLAGDADARGTIFLAATLYVPAGTPIDLNVVGDAGANYPDAWAELELYRGSTRLADFIATAGTVPVTLPAFAGETLIFHAWVSAHGGDAGTYGGFMADFSATPEPATLGALALVGLLAIRRR